MATVDILGHQVNKGGLIAGGLVATAVSAYLIYKHHKEAATTAAAPASFGYGYGYAYGYGQYGYGLNIASEGYGYGGGVVSGGGAGVAPPVITYAYGYGGNTVPTGGTAAPTSNTQWMADAEQALTATGGYDITTVSAALGKYLTGGTLTSDQAQIVQAAMALVGNPPQAGANGYPPGIHVGAPTGQTGTTPAGGTVTVPKLDGQSVNAAIGTLTSLGLKYKLSSVRNPASTYVVNSQTPGAGAKVAKGSTVDLGIKKT